MTAKTGLRWWATTAMFVSWLVYYTLWGSIRDRFGEWFLDLLTRHAYWIKADGA